MPELKLSKAGTLDLLDSFQLNTLKRTVLRPPFTKESISEAIDAWHEDSMGLRTWRPKDFKCTFWYNRPKAEMKGLVAENMEILRKYKEIILYTSLDKTDAILSGKVIHTPMNTEVLGIVEILRGPYTVRDLENVGVDCPDREHFLVSKWEVDETHIVCGMVQRLRPLFYKYPGCVVEFSLYPYPVGQRQEQFIFWEVTG